MATQTKGSWMSNALRWPAVRLKEFTYSEAFLKLARRLPFAGALRRVYQWVSGGRKNILCVNLGGGEVYFHVQSPRQYRAIEANLLRLERFFLDVLMNSLKEGEVFLDVGSSMGEFAIPVARAVGKCGLVIAIEPEASSAQELEQNVRLNRLTNVRTFKIALSDHEGEAQLWTDGACPTLFRAPTSGVAESVRVEVGDLMLERERSPVPKAIKIDVEGFEYQVIRGLRQTLRNPHCRILCCEIHPYSLPDGITPDVIADEAKSLGFGKIIITPRTSELQMVASKD